MNCGTCKFWNPLNRLMDDRGWASDKGQVAGECRRDAPRPSQAQGGAWRVFPVTIATDSCGQFQAKYEPKPVDVKAEEQKVDRAIAVIAQACSTVKPKKKLDKV